MFIIVPKKQAKRPAITANPPHQAQAGTPPAPENGGPTRAAAACDSCRSKKIKCDGQRPCAKCQQKGVICAYTRPAQRETQVSAGQVAVLRSQQRRLCAAVQQMASTIARYEEGVWRSPDSFEISHILEKFAPEPSHEGQSGSAKRPAEYQLTPDPSATRTPRLERPAPTANTSLDSSAHGRTNPADLPFELRPSPNWSGTQEQWNEQYQAMMQFLQTYNGSSSGNGSSLVEALVHPSGPSAITMSAGQQSADSNQRLMQLVDWNSSLQNLRTSADPPPPSNPGQFLDPALGGSTDPGASHTHIDPALGNGAT